MMKKKKNWIVSLRYKKWLWVIVVENCFDFTPVESSRSSDKELRVQPRSYLKTYGERAFSFIAPKPTMEYPPIKYKTLQGSGIF